MSQCQIKRGYFVLRGCDNAADRPCEDCGKLTCREHAATGSARYLCRDCDSKLREVDVSSEVNDGNWGDFLLWKSRQRSHALSQGALFSSHNYGSSNDSSRLFNSNDYAGFSSNQDEPSFDDPLASDELLNS